MEGDFIKINKWFIPLSWLYGCIIGFRNFLFEVGVLKSRAFDIPVISVGNITVGGTGKTPHVEYLINLLQHKFNVTVLSRGYKRQSKGFVVATDKTLMSEIGDEPYQIKKKFPKITVAVDNKRVHGIETLIETNKETDVVLLDDAFQHRYVKPGINILLVDYHRLIIYDKLLPAGRLREPLSGKDRADIVIITKCPKNLRPMEYRVITKAMNLYPYQQLFFTRLAYNDLKHLYSEKTRTLESISSEEHVLLLTGIASPRQLREDLTPYVKHLTPLRFPDHHNFTDDDIQRINDTFAQLPSPKIVITTEKDAARITNTLGFSQEIKDNIYSLPVKIKFLLEQDEMFNEKIIDYVRKNSRNSILVKTKDDNKSKDSHNTGNGPRTISF